MIVPAPAKTPLNARPAPALRLTLNPHQARQFLEPLYGPFYSQATRLSYLEVRGRKETDPPGKMTFNRFYLGSENLLKDAERWNPELNYWIGVALRKSDKGGKKDDCLALPALYCDVDYGQDGHQKKNKWRDKAEALAAIQASPLRTSILIHSGGGFQLYWLLDTPLGLESGKYAQVEAIMKGLTLALGGDVGTQDVSRILRLPGTYNMKLAENPRPVEIVWCEPQRVYSLAEFAQYEAQGRTAQDKTEIAPTGPQTTDLEALKVPKWVKGLILSGDSSGYNNDRSARDHAVIGALVRAGCNLDTIEAIYEANPVGNKYREKGPHRRAYLQTSIKAPSLAPSKAREKLTSIATGFNLTDLGNAQRLVARHGQDMRYCYPWCKWLVWDGVRWAKDESGEVDRRAKETVRSIYAEASAIEGEDDYKKSLRQAIAEHAKRSESDSKRQAMINSARSEPGVAILPANLDQDPWLLNVLNGTVDLRTGQLQPHNRKDLITKLAPATYNPKAECPIWWAFLQRIMSDNFDLITFFQKAVGYALTGKTKEQCLFFLYGLGANGKTTFIEVIQAMLGDYATQTTSETFMAKRYSSPISNDVADLRGARFVAAVEIESGRRMAEVLIKQMTGGDKLKARFLYSEHFEFKPEFKIFLAANHKPVIRGTDNAIWRRIRLIPFTVQIPEAEQDRKLPEKLKAELPGILNWAIEGCINWQDHGLDPPQAVKEATQTYRQEMDILADFLAECCITAPGASALATELYKAYTAWAEESGEKKPFSQTLFGTVLAERGFERTRATGGKTLWKGIGVKG